jgi:hypothetical protein
MTVTCSLTDLPAAARIKDSSSTGDRRLSNFLVTLQNLRRNLQLRLKDLVEDASTTGGTKKSETSAVDMVLTAGASPQWSKGWYSSFQQDQACHVESKSLVDS